MTTEVETTMQRQFVKNGDRIKSGAMPAARNERLASAATLVLNNNNNNCSLAAPMADTLPFQQTAVTIAAPPSQRPSASSVSTGAFILLVYLPTPLYLAFRVICSYTHSDCVC